MFQFDSSRFDQLVLMMRKLLKKEPFIVTSGGLSTMRNLLGQSLGSDYQVKQPSTVTTLDVDLSRGCFFNRPTDVHFSLLCSLWRSHVDSYSQGDLDGSSFSSNAMTGLLFKRLGNKVLVDEGDEASFIRKDFSVIYLGEDGHPCGFAISWLKEKWVITSVYDAGLPTAQLTAFFCPGYPHEPSLMEDNDNKQATVKKLPFSEFKTELQRCLHSTEMKRWVGSTLIKSDGSLNLEEFDRLRLQHEKFRVGNFAKKTPDSSDLWDDLDEEGIDQILQFAHQVFRSLRSVALTPEEEEITNNYVVQLCYALKGRHQQKLDDADFKLAVLDITKNAYKKLDASKWRQVFEVVTNALFIVTGLFLVALPAHRMATGNFFFFTHSTASNKLRYARDSLLKHIPRSQ